MLCLLQESCPEDVLATILSFAGPQTTAALAQTNRYWNHAANQESVWRFLCQVTGKLNLPMRTTNDKSLSSWRRHYQEHIMVPLDFPTLSSAIEYANIQFLDKDENDDVEDKTIHILLQASKAYTVSEPLVINGGSGADSRLIIAVVPSSLLSQNNYDDATQPQTLLVGGYQDTNTVKIVMDAIRGNQPLFHIQQGHLELQNMRLEHYSPVNLMELMNVRNQNAAILLDSQSQSQHQQQQPSLTMSNVTITSYSGRGILNRCKNTTTTTSSSSTSSSSHSNVQMHNCFIAKMY